MCKNSPFCRNLKMFLAIYVWNLKMFDLWRCKNLHTQLAHGDFNFGCNGRLLHQHFCRLIAYRYQINASRWSSALTKCPICSVPSIKNVNRLICLLNLKALQSPNTNKHETAHAKRREHSACLFSFSKILQIFGLRIRAYALKIKYVYYFSISSCLY